MSYVIVSLGPPKRFVGGRRVRDLWYGSRFLAEITRQVANALPYTIDAPRAERLKDDFFPTHRNLDGGKAIGAVIPNVIEFRTEDDDSTLQSQLEAAYQKGLKFIDAQISSLIKDNHFKCLIVLEDVEQQRAALASGDGLAFYAGWGPERRDAARMLGRAKQSRIFSAPATRPGLGRSDQDAGADNALFEPDPAHPKTYRKLRHARTMVGIKGAERLHILALVKRRAAFENQQSQGKRYRLPRQPFPSIGWVTAYPWLKGIQEDMGARQSLSMLREVFTALWDGNAHELFIRLRGDQDALAKRLGRVVGGALIRLGETVEAGGSIKAATSQDALALLSSPITEHRPDGSEQVVFDFDPSVLFDNGISTLWRSLDELERRRPVGPIYGDRDFPAIELALQASGQASPPFDEVRALAYMALHLSKGYVERLSQPEPYYALIEADGDGIGELLNKLNDSQRTRFGEALDTFTDAAWRIPERVGGVVFYCGGDELLTAVPLDQIQLVVKKLTDEFQLVAETISTPVNRPSLSFGVVIAHWKDHLGRIRGRVGQALSDAKTDRRLAGAHTSYITIEENPRGGSTRTLTGELSSQMELLNHFVEAMNTKVLSLSTVAGLIDLCQRFEGFDDPLSLALAQTEFRRRAKRSGYNQEGELFEFINKALADASSWADVRSLANLMLVAERIDRTRAQRNLTKTQEAS